MAGRRVKEGKLRRYKHKLFGGKWTDSKVVLYEDATWVWYEDSDESRPLGSINLKQLAPFFAIGVYSTRLPHRPQLPSGAKIDHVLAFGTGPSRDAKIHWFLCANEEDLTLWMSGIVSTLPPPPQPPQEAPPPQAPPVYTQGGHPAAQPGYYPQQAPYPQQPPGAWGPQAASGGYYPRAPATTAPATVVMAPSSYPGYTGGSSSGWGTAAGLGTGMLAGGLMGYTLGSMMHPGWGWGSGYGYGGYGPGHSGYYDNDTTIINNYNTTNTDNGTFSDSGQYGDTAGGGSFDYGGSGLDYGGDSGTGGFDDGGGDFDFGGGDF